MIHSIKAPNSEKDLLLWSHLHIMAQVGKSLSRILSA